MGRISESVACTAAKYQITVHLVVYRIDNLKKSLKAMCQTAKPTDINRGWISSDIQKMNTEPDFKVAGCFNIKSSFDLAYISIQFHTLTQLTASAVLKPVAEGAFDVLA